MIFKRHKIPAKKKEEEVYFKLTKSEMQTLQILLMDAETLGVSRMESHNVDILDRIKCKKADEIDWKEEYAKFEEEKAYAVSKLQDAQTVIHNAMGV